MSHVAWDWRILYTHVLRNSSGPFLYLTPGVWRCLMRSCLNLFETTLTIVLYRVPLPYKYFVNLRSQLFSQRPDHVIASYPSMRRQPVGLAQWFFCSGTDEAEISSGVSASCLYLILSGKVRMRFSARSAWVSKPTAVSRLLVVIRFCWGYLCTTTFGHSLLRPWLVYAAGCGGKRIIGRKYKWGL